MVASQVKLAGEKNAVFLVGTGEPLMSLEQGELYGKRLYMSRCSWVGKIGGGPRMEFSGKVSWEEAERLAVVGG